MGENRYEYVNADALGTAKFFIHIGRKREANQVLDTLYPFCQTFEQFDAIGYVYTKNRNFRKGLEIALRQLPKAKTPEQMWDCRVNVIRSYLNTQQPHSAMRYIKANKAINPEDQPNLMDEAYALFLMNRKDEGEKILRKLIEAPSSEDVYNRCLFNLGSYDLRAGNFKVGINNFLLAGRKMEIWEEFSLPNKYWDGQVIPGATVVMMAEGGIGDEIINIRFQRHIRALGMTPVWCTSRGDLADVFERCGFNVIRSKREIQPEWLWTYSMLAVCYLGIEEPELWNGPYLSPVQSIAPVKGLFTRKKVGIKISGNPDYDQDLARSVGLSEFLQCIPATCEIVSFHKDEKFNHPRITEWMTNETTWDDTLNKIEEMDVIVTTCTSLAHAAGAIGKRTMVMVPILKYYLWCNDKKKSPWYGDNVVVLHQAVAGCWENVFLDIMEGLM